MTDRYPLINILTRTSGRPKFFYLNWLSVQKQTYKKVRHIVSYDDQATQEYLADYVDSIDIFPVERVERLGNDHFPYNLYLNILQDKVTDGWIMFLDDDDWFLDEQSLVTIAQALNDPTELVLWKVQFPNRVVPKKIPKTQPTIGGVSCIGFAFHHSQKHLVNWGDRKGGDYKVISYLYKKLQVKWIDAVLTGVNYQFNRTSGSGQRLDFGERFRLFAQKDKKVSPTKQMDTQTIVNLDQIAKRFLKPSEASELDDEQNIPSLAEIKLQLSQKPNPSKVKTVPKEKTRQVRKTGQKRTTRQVELEQTAEPSVAEQTAQAAESSIEEVEEAVAEPSQETAQETAQATDQEAEQEEDQATDQEADQEDSASESETQEAETKEKYYLISEAQLDRLVQKFVEAINQQTKPVSIPQLTQTTGVKLLSAKEQLNQIQNPANKLNNLLQGYQNKKHVSFSEELEEVKTIERVADVEASFDQSMTLNNLFGQVYIIDQHNHANDLKAKLAKFDIDAKIIRTKATKANTGLLNYLAEVAQEAHKKGLESVLVMLDIVLPYRSLADEIRLQWHNIQQSDWKILYLGATQNLVKNAELDVNFYSQMYPDLHDANIGQNSQLCTRHWNFYGKKEGRFGARCVAHPDMLKNISCIALNSSVFEEVAKHRKVVGLTQALTKHLKQKSFAVSPLWFLTEPGKYNKARNKHNLHLY